MTAQLLNLARTGRVLIAGAGISGAGIAAILADLGAVNVTVVDDDAGRATQVAPVCGAGTATVADAVAGLDDADLILISPGWRPDSPLAAAAAAAGVPVVGEVALARAADAAGTWGPPRTWLVVTGTNGKTTTTAMLAAMLGDRGLAVGNIGVALHAALTREPRVDVLAAELSSFQLHWAPDLAPEAGVLLNLAEDHIDWHGSFGNYADDKAVALSGQIAVYGADDSEVARRIPGLVDSGSVTGRLVAFTAAEPAPGEVGVADGHIVDRAFADDGSPAGDGPGTVIAPVAGISPPGPAGILDAVAATALARAAGTPAAGIAAGLEGFTVSPHRGQVVHSAGGVDWIDDSKATNPHAADAALRGHDRVVWVAGGQLKGADVVPLVSGHSHRLRAAVLLGCDAPLIAAALADHAPDVPVTVIGDTDPAGAMDAAVAAAAGAATAGDVVLLAPAAASLDMYTGMGQRGDLFAAAVRATAEGEHL